MCFNKYLSFALLTFSFTVNAQQKVSGTAFDEEGNTIKSCNVSLVKGNKRINSLTNANGVYQFANVEKGKYQLVLQHKNMKEEMEISVEDKDVSMDMYMFSEYTSSKLDEIVIKVATAKEEIEKKGFAVNVIETGESSLRNMQTNELLDRTAGVKIRQDGGLGSRINYNLNGMTGNAIKIFIDGVPSTNFGQSFSLNSISPALIERIEVYKGVVPGYLSEDALGGAINVVLKKHKKNIVNASYSYGSFNTHQANINGSFQGKKGFLFDFSSFFNHSDNNYEVWGEDIMFRNYDGSLTRNNRAKRFHDAFTSLGSKIDVGFSNVKWADRFTIGGVFSEDYKEIQHGVTMQRVFGDRHSRRNANIATLNYRKKDLLLRGLSVNVDASYSQLKNQAIDTVGIMYDWRGQILYPDGRPVRYTSGAEQGSEKTAEINLNKTLVLRGNIGYKINDYNSVFVNYLFNDFKREVSDEYLPSAVQFLQNTRDLQKNIATITYENLSFNDRLRTNIFYKHYKQTVTSNEPYKIQSTPVPVYGMKSFDKSEEFDGYGAALSYALSSKIYVLASAEKAIRFPNETEVFGNVASLVNPGNVHAEESFNANIGLNIATLSYKKHGIKSNISLFYRDTKGMIRQAETSGNSGTTYYENLEDVLTRGFDAEITYTYSNKLNLTLNISKFDVLFNTQFNNKGEKYLYYRQQIRNEPSFKYNVSAAYYFEDLFVKKSKASIHYNVNYVKGFRRNWSNVGLTNLDIIPTQFSNDAGVMFTFPSQKVTIGLDAKNIFNNQLYDNFGLQKPGRAFYGKITFNIL